MSARRALHNRYDRKTGIVGGLNVRAKYFLTGFARCEVCGGGIHAVSRASSGGRLFRYVCGMHYNRGAAVCGNGRMVPMPVADGAVADLIKAEVLKPRVMDRALDLALELLHQESKVPDRELRSDLTRRLREVETELANLAETAARGGAVPIVLDALARRDEERRRLTAEMVALDHSPENGRMLSRRASRTELRSFLDCWGELLTGNRTEARPLLDLVLAGQQIGFKPAAQGGYELTVPIAFDRVIAAAIPALAARKTHANPVGDVTLSCNPAGSAPPQTTRDRMRSVRAIRTDHQR